MRIIAGEAKGHSLKCPKEPRIRPTADLVRGAIFSALEAAAIDWSSILDLYAGTGAMGIEALSRGAEEADFVEQNAKCCSIINENLKHTGFTERARVYRLDAGKALRNLKKRYTLIFLDPPYSDQGFWAVLGDIATSDLVENKTTIVLEHSQKSKPEASYGSFHITNNLHHGDTYVSIFRHEGGRN